MRLKMILQTASEGISLAKKLESDSAQFYEALALKYPQNGEGFKAMAKENKKYVSQTETAYFGVISDAIEGCYAFHIDPAIYAINIETSGISSYKNALTQALKIEETIIKFYTEAAEQSKSLMADVPRTFSLIARKRGERLSKLKSMISAS
jgi:rubrerythrin